MQGNCGICGSGLLAGEKLGQCLECGQFTCESCHSDYCKACNKRFAANLAAELKGAARVQRLGEGPEVLEPGLTKKRAMWSEYGIAS